MTSQYVLITGCSAGGIGHELVISFQKRGYTVFATARSIEKMRGLASMPNVHLISLDVTSPPSISAALLEVKIKSGGKLDVLINNAGQQLVMPALDLDVDAAKALFDVNYFAPLRMVQQFSDLLIHSKGCVVNIASTAAVLTMPLQSQYNASKAAMVCLSETLRLELDPLGVRVITVMAGGTKSNIFINAPAPASLPATSHYLPIEKLIAQEPKWDEDPTEKFTELVANAVTSKTTGKIWTGPSNGIIRWLVPIMPTWLFVRMPGGLRDPSVDLEKDRLMISIGRGIKEMPRSV